MKTSLRNPLLFGALALTIISLGFSSGQGSFGRGHTGAPSSGGGVEPTCSVCHSGGSFGEPQLSVAFDSSELTAYQPGRTYIVTVTIEAGMGTPAGYGFMTQFLNEADPIPATAGTLAEPSENAKITVIDDRTYAEHNQSSAENQFSFEWTAPEAGTGSVNMYLVGNTVNGANGNGGDNASTSPLIVNLTEDMSTATLPGREALPATVAPNPTDGLTNLSLEVPTSGRYELVLFSATGQQLSQRSLNLPVGRQSITLDLSEQPAGIYYARLLGQRAGTTVRLVRR